MFDSLGLYTRGPVSLAGCFKIPRRPRQSSDSGFHFSVEPEILGSRRGRQLDSSAPSGRLFLSFRLRFTLAMPLLIDEATRLANVPARKATSMASMTGVIFTSQSRTSTPAAEMLQT